MPAKASGRRSEIAFLITLLLVLTLLPLVFVYVYSLGGRITFMHIETRLNIIMLLQVLTFGAIGFISGGFRDLFSTLSWRALALLCALFAIAISKLFLEIGDFILTQQRVSMWLGHILFGLATYTVFRRFDVHIALSFVSIAIIASSFVYVIYVFIFHFPLFGSANWRDCALPGFRNIRYTGYFVSIALALCMALSSSPKMKIWLRALVVALAVFFWYFTFYSGSRAIIFAFLGAVVVIAFFQKPLVSARLVAVLAITAVIGAVLIKVFPPMGCSGLDTLHRIAVRSTVENVSSGRVAIWQLSWDLIGNHPWFGNGEIRLRNVAETRVTQTHNSILQSLLAWGIVGATIFWLLLGEFILRLLFGLRQMVWHAQPLLFAILTVLAYSLIDATLYYSYPLLLLTLLMSGAAAVWMKMREDNGSA